jgi:hypothetical protein
MSSSHDSRRASQGGTLGIGHDPRRGASSPQWNREPPQMAQQFQRRHTSPYDSPYGKPYDSPYGGQFGGYENSREPHHSPGSQHREHERQSRGESHGEWRGNERDMAGRYGRSDLGDFGGYGDYDLDERGFDQRRDESRGGPWMQRGQVPNEFSRDDFYRSSAAQGGHHDPDYDQWRREQLQRLDEDYEAYRRERYTKFSDDFNAWRAARTPSSSNASSGDKQGKSGGNKQQS